MGVKDTQLAARICEEWEQWVMQINILDDMFKGMMEVWYCRSKKKK